MLCKCQEKVFVLEHYSRIKLLMFKKDEETGKSCRTCDDVLDGMQDFFLVGSWFPIKFLFSFFNKWPVRVNIVEKSIVPDRLSVFREPAWHAMKKNTWCSKQFRNYTCRHMSEKVKSICMQTNLSITVISRTFLPVRRSAVPVYAIWTSNIYHRKIALQKMAKLLEKTMW